MSNHCPRHVAAVCAAVLLLLSPLAGARTIGPDAFGVMGTDEFTYSWEEIAQELGGDGTEIVSLRTTDDEYAAIPIGFGFRFYGTRYTSVYVNVNGLLAFASNGLHLAFTNEHLPAVNTPNNTIAVFWDDLNLWPTQRIYYMTAGVAPYRRLIVQWYDIAHFDDPEARYQFQAILYESVNQIRFQYREMINGMNHFYGDGRSATIGIEDAAGSTGLEWSYNTMHSVSSATAFVFYPPVAADMQIRKQAAPRTVSPYSDLVYTLIVSNAGPDGATEVQVVDTLPDGVTFLSAAAGQGSANHANGVVTCALGAIEENRSVVVTIRVQVVKSGVLTNTATVAATQTDPDPSNNAATQTVAVGTALQNDFNGDGRSDLGVYDATQGRWYVRSLGGNVLEWNTAWGFAGATPCAADYNGDAATDLATYSAANGQWFIRSAYGPVLAWKLAWGFAGSLAAPGDYDGDGSADLGVFDPAGKWYIRTLAGKVLAYEVAWGFSGAMPAPGDYDGDGRCDLAVFDPAAGKWYIRTLAGEVLAWGLKWGFADTAPVPGDYDGDGVTDLAVYDVVTGRWYVRRMDGVVLAWAAQHGFAGARPVGGDFDGDRVSDLAVYAPATGMWYIKRLSGKMIAWEEKWGWSAAAPVQAQYWINDAFGF